MPKKDIPPFVQLDRGKNMHEMWEGFSAMVLPLDASQVQREEMRNAFFAGGLCLFNWFMSQMDEGAEPTDADEDRVEKMHEELHAYFGDYLKRHGLG